jgi:hypothetical protein
MMFRISSWHAEGVAKMEHCGCTSGAGSDVCSCLVIDGRDSMRQRYGEDDEDLLDIDPSEGTC